MLIVANPVMGYNVLKQFIFCRRGFEKLMTQQVYNFFTTSTFRQTLLVLTMPWVLSCGELPKLVDQQNIKNPPVVLASYKQLEEGSVLAGSYIVAFNTYLPETNLQFSTYLQEYQTHYQPLAANFLSDSKIKDINFITSVDLSMASLKKDDFSLFAPPNLQLAWQGSKKPIVASLARVDFQTPQDAEELLKKWEKSGTLWFAEPNHFNKVFDDSPNPFASYKDSYKEVKGYWHEKTNLLKAFDALSTKTLGDPPIIAVMDSGVDVKHSELAERIWENPRVGAEGCQNDTYGCNTTTTRKGSLGDGDVFPVGTLDFGASCPHSGGAGNKDDDNCSHGTHVAGIIAGKSVPSGAQSRGGMCPFCQIMAVRIVGINEAGDIGALDSSIIAGLKYVTLFRKSSSLGIRIINASFGKFVRSRAVDILVRVLNETGNGALVVGAAGNEDVMQMSYPAAFSDALAVAAVNAEDKKANFSNFGSWVDIAAPGVDIYATVPGGGSEAKSGTSMAAPVTAGIAGLVIAAEPGISASELKDRLMRTADSRLYDYDPNGDNFNQYYYPRVSGEDFSQPLLGTGVVDAYAAVTNTVGRELPIYTGLDRVTAQCGTIGGHPSRFSVPALLICFLLPLLLAAFGRRLRKLRQH